MFAVGIEPQTIIVESNDCGTEPAYFPFPEWIITPCIEIVEVPPEAWDLLPIREDMPAENDLPDSTLDLPRFPGYFFDMPQGELRYKYSPPAKLKFVRLLMSMGVRPVKIRAISSFVLYT